MCRISHMQIYTHFHIKYVFLWIPNYSFKVAYAHFKPNFVRTQFLHHMSSVINISHLGPLVCWKPRQSECSMFCLFNLIVCLTKCYGSQQQQHQQQQQQQWSRRLKHTAKWIAFFSHVGSQPWGKGEKPSPTPGSSSSTPIWAERPAPLAEEEERQTGEIQRKL